MTPGSLILKTQPACGPCTASHVISAVVQRSRSSSWGIQVLQGKESLVSEGAVYLRWHLNTHLHTNITAHSEVSTWAHTAHTAVVSEHTEPGITHCIRLQHCSNDSLVLMNQPGLHHQQILGQSQANTPQTGEPNRSQQIRADFCTGQRLKHQWTHEHKQKWILKQTGLKHPWSLDWTRAKTPVNKQLLPSLPICMKPSSLSLECPREVANVSSSCEDLQSLSLRLTVSTVWAQKANLHWHARRHLTFKKNPVWGQKRKAAPMHFVYKIRVAGLEN